VSVLSAPAGTAAMAETTATHDDRDVPPWTWTPSAA